MCVNWKMRSSVRWWSRRNLSFASRTFTLKARNGVGLGIGDVRSLEDVERAHILRVLDECSGNQTRTAEVLGIDRVTLHHKLKKYGWNRKEKEQLATSN